MCFSCILLSRSHLISSHLISSHLISSHLWWNYIESMSQILQEIWQIGLARLLQKLLMDHAILVELLSGGATGHTVRFSCTSDFIHDCFSLSFHSKDSISKTSILQSSVYSLHENLLADCRLCLIGISGAIKAVLYRNSILIIRLPIYLLGPYCVSTLVFVIGT